MRSASEQSAGLATLARAKRSGDFPVAVARKIDGWKAVAPLARGENHTL